METGRCEHKKKEQNYNSHPQGDGNSLCCWTTKAFLNYNSHPQGDGNMAIYALRVVLLITTHTRKGMETGPFNLLFKTLHYNSHPQGDGNRLLCLFFLFIYITTHTRKGMETYRRLLMDVADNGLQLTPARGWKHNRDTDGNKYQITTHTRKGMETVSSGFRHSMYSLQLTPARGWKQIEAIANMAGR